MDDNRLPLEQRIGSVRDGDTTDHGTPIGSTPLAVQPPRRRTMHEIVQECATNVTETDGNATAVGDIVDRLTPHLLVGHTSQTPHLLGGDIVELLRTVIATPNGVDIWTTTALAAADEIQRLRAQVRSQALELLIAHSEALRLYDITMTSNHAENTWPLTGQENP